MWGSGNCYNHIGRTSTDDELVNYLNHPGNALKLIQSLEKFGYPDGIPPPDGIPDDIWFEAPVLLTVWRRGDWGGCLVRCR